MRLRIGFSFVWIFTIWVPAFTQDLGQLMPRVSQFWEAKKQSNRVAAMRFIDPQTQNIFLENNESPFSTFKVTGVEFTDDLNRVDVLVKVRSLVPRVGELDRAVREEWVWKDGQWLMRATPPPTMFDSDTKNRPSQPIQLEFKIATTVIDAGRHSQGERIEGKIPFAAARDEIVVIRPLAKIPGLSIGSPVWASSSEGYLPYQWDTTLLSQDINQKISLEATANSDVRVSREIEFRLRMNGKVGFKQTPEIVDASKPGQVELQLQNLTATPLKILGVVLHNRSYVVVDEEIPTSIDPGRSGRLLIRYTAQIEPMAASLLLTLSEPLTPSGVITIPLNVKLPEEKASRYTVEDLRPRIAVPQPVNPPLPRK